jgi:hypothetical protein
LRFLPTVVVLSEALAKSPPVGKEWDQSIESHGNGALSFQIHLVSRLHIAMRVVANDGHGWL